MRVGLQWTAPARKPGEQLGGYCARRAGCSSRPGFQPVDVSPFVGVGGGPSPPGFGVTRSNWHSHAGWQILAAEEGRGRTQARDGEIIEMVPGGRAVFAPAGLVHWHGASPAEHVVQLTVLGGGDGGPTSWFGPVSEEEYRGQ